MALMGILARFSSSVCRMISARTNKSLFSSSLESLPTDSMGKTSLVIADTLAAAPYDVLLQATGRILLANAECDYVTSCIIDRATLTKTIGRSQPSVCESRVHQVCTDKIRSK